MKRSTIEDMQKIASNRNGKCISTVYKNAHSKLQWECCLKHIWHALPCNVVQGKWCPYCKSGKNEERCRFILEQLTGLQFVKTRSVIGGELDGFCKHLNLAFEYHGIQHFENIPYFKNDFMKIQSKDKAKREECCRRNIGLIEIPYFVAEKGSSGLENYIRDKLLASGVSPSAKVDYSQENESLVSRINQIRAKDHLTCLGIDRIHGGRTYVKMKCKNSHEWTAQSYPIVYKGGGCPICAGQNRTIDDVKLIAAERNGKCMSSEYISATNKMRWLCSCGHAWMATLNKILCGRWCPECAKKSRIENRRLNKGWSYEMICQLYKKGTSIKNICSKLNICSATAKKAIGESNAA